MAPKESRMPTAFFRSCRAGLVFSVLVLLFGAWPMLAESPNEALLRAYIEAWNSGNLELLDSIVTDGFVRHGNYGSTNSREGLKQRISDFHGFYRNLHIEVQDSFASDTKGAMRWRFTGGYGETSFEIDTLNFSMYHFIDGRISEEWVAGNTTDFWTSMGYTIMPPGTKMIPPPVELPADYEVHEKLEVDGSSLAAYAEQSRLLPSRRSGRIEITSDVDCKLALDGKAIGWLAADQTVVLSLERGKRLLQASSRGGSLFFSETLEVRRGKTVPVEIEAPGRVIIHPRNRTAEHLETGLMWQMTDNGNDISQRDAEAYCRDLDQGDYADWRLPSIFELENLYAPETEGSKRFQTIPGITLSACCPWTSTPHGDFHWTFVFYNGLRYIKYQSIGKASRALCVRNTWETPQTSE
jgi:hypothetical protein